MALGHPLAPRRVLAGSWTPLAQLLGGSCPVFGALGSSWAVLGTKLGRFGAFRWHMAANLVAQVHHNRSKFDAKMYFNLDSIFSSIFQAFLLPTCTPKTQLKSSGLAFSWFFAPKVDIDFWTDFYGILHPFCDQKTSRNRILEASWDILASQNGFSTAHPVLVLYPPAEKS